MNCCQHNAVKGKCSKGLEMECHFGAFVLIPGKRISRDFLVQGHARSNPSQDTINGKLWLFQFDVKFVCRVNKCKRIDQDMFSTTGSSLKIFQDEVKYEALVLFHLTGSEVATQRCLSLVLRVYPSVSSLPFLSAFLRNNKSKSRR